MEIWETQTDQSFFMAVVMDLETIIVVDNK